MQYNNNNMYIYDTGIYLCVFLSFLYNDTVPIYR